MKKYILTIFCLILLFFISQLELKALTNYQLGTNSPCEYEFPNVPWGGSEVTTFYYQDCGCYYFIEFYKRKVGTNPERCEIQITNIWFLGGDNGQNSLTCETCVPHNKLWKDALAYLIVANHAGCEDDATLFAAVQAPCIEFHKAPDDSWRLHFPLSQLVNVAGLPNFVSVVNGIVTATVYSRYVNCQTNNVCCHMHYTLTRNLSNEPLILDWDHTMSTQQEECPNPTTCAASCSRLEVSWVYGSIANDIGENNESFNYEIYPNPSNGKFEMKLMSNYLGSVNIEFFNILGTKVYSTNFLKESVLFAKSINLENYISNGLYYFSIKENNNTVRSSKIMILK